MACGVFYIIEKLLEHRYLNGPALLIWTSKTQVMAKRRAGNKTTSLTLNPIYLFVDNMQHTVGNLPMRVTTLLQNAFRSKVYSQSYGAPKLRESQFGRFQDSHLGILGQKTI
jgi:hypothetical protein